MQNKCERATLVTFACTLRELHASPWNNARVFVSAISCLLQRGLYMTPVEKHR